MTTTNYANMTKEEIMNKLIETEEKMTKLEQSKSKGLKIKISELIDSGFNTIESIAEELDTSKKNVSSYLSYLRNELYENNEWIISSTIKQKTYVKKVKLDELGWFVK